MKQLIQIIIFISVLLVAESVTAPVSAQYRVVYNYYPYYSPNPKSVLLTEYEYHRYRELKADKLGLGGPIFQILFGVGAASVSAYYGTQLKCYHFSTCNILWISSLTGIFIAIPGIKKIKVRLKKRRELRYLESLMHWEFIGINNFEVQF